MLRFDAQKKRYTEFNQTMAQIKQTISIFIIFLFCLTVNAQKKADNSFPHLKERAEKGDPKTMYQLGLMLESNKEKSQANTWFKAAAESLMLNINDERGRMFYKKELIDNDLELAFSIFKKGAQAGSSKAMIYMGMLYRDGTACKINKMKSIKWFKKAAKHGEAEAEYQLAMMYRYLKGIGKNQDFFTAFKHFLKSAEMGSVNGMKSTANKLRRGLGTTKNLEEAFKWFKKGAEAGNTYCMTQLWYCYLLGQGTEKDQTKAEYWRKKAEEQKQAGVK